MRESLSADDEAPKLPIAKSIESADASLDDGSSRTIAGSL